MNIAMIGTGYVGLVSGACFSEFGVDVSCVDKDAAKIERLLAGEMPIYEPGLDRLVASSVAAGRLSFTTDLGAVLLQPPPRFGGVVAVRTEPRRLAGDRGTRIHLLQRDELYLATPDRPPD